MACKMFFLAYVLFLLLVVSSSATAENAVLGSFPGGDAPFCSTGASPCIAGSNLLISQDNWLVTQEPDQPNTIDGCSDGTDILAQYWQEESLDNLTVTEIGGDGNFNPGDTVEVEAQSYCFSTTDRIGFAYTNSSSTPDWTVLYAVNCLQAGFNATRFQFTLDSIPGYHAVRGIIRYNPIGSGCDFNTDYDDHDDISFIVVSGTCPDASCQSGETCPLDCDPEPHCGDGIDNDGDLLPDCADADCDGQPCGAGTCTGGACVSVTASVAPGFEPGSIVIVLAALLAGALPLTFYRKN